MTAPKNTGKDRTERDHTTASSERWAVYPADLLSAPPAVLAVYSHINIRGRYDGVTPTLDELARHTGLSERDVAIVVAGLTELGYLEWNTDPSFPDQR